MAKETKEVFGPLLFAEAEANWGQVLSAGDHNFLNTFGDQNYGDVFRQE